MHHMPAHAPRPWRILLVLLVGILILTACGQAVTSEPPNTAPEATSSPSSPLSSPGSPTEAPAASFSVLEELVLPSEPSLHRDAHGVGVQIAAESLSADQQFVLRSGEGGVAALAELEAYRVPGLPLYQLDLRGEGEGSGQVELVVPAEHPATRVVEIIDGAALIVYEVEPVEGVIRLPLQIADSVGSDVDIMFAGGSRSFAVLGPGPTAASRSWPNPFTARSAHAQDRDHRPCRIGFPPVELKNCWTTWNGTATVTWNRAGLLTPWEAQAILSVATELQNALVAQEFVNASPSAANPLKIVVDPGDGLLSVDAPTYNSTLGVIKLPLDSAQNIRGDTPRLELAHELMHWTQDVAYNMLWGFVRSESRWWLEVTAEIGTFLVEANGADANARIYGQTHFNEQQLVFQASPYAWQVDEQYLQAQLVYANMCGAGCPLTQEQVVSAINRGTYPLADQGLRSQISERIEAYAHYVLTGQHPDGREVTAFKTGVAVGDFVQLARNKADGAMRWIVSNYQQFDTTTRQFSANLATDSIYPLVVGAGSKLQPITGMPSPSGPPAMLVIDPGLPFLYQLDGGAVQRHDGQSELWLGPIHDPLGHQMIRLVAYAGATPGQFKARIEEIDLNGDWVLSFSNPRVLDFGCTGDDTDDSELDAAETIELLGLLSSYAATRGSYTQDSSQLDTFHYMLPTGVEFCDDEGCERISYASNLTLEPDGIRIIQHLNIAQPTASQPVEAPLLVLALGLPLGLLVVAGRRRRLLLAVIALLIVPQLSGCIELEIYGSLGSATTFKQIELLRDNDPASGPLVRLSAGEGEQTLDFTFVGGMVDPFADEASQEPPKVSVCRGRIAVAATAELFPEGVVAVPAGLFDDDDD
jgi:hypothetical protein